MKLKFLYIFFNMHFFSFSLSKNKKILFNIFELFISYCEKYFSSKNFIIFESISIFFISSFDLLSIIFLFFSINVLNILLLFNKPLL